MDLISPALKLGNLHDQFVSQDRKLLNINYSKLVIQIVFVVFHCLSDKVKGGFRYFESLQKYL